MTEKADSFFAHYGVPGMRWGKTSRSSGRGGSSSNLRPRTSRESQDHLTVRKIKKKSVANMSNAELKAYTTRVGLEKQYRALNPGKIARGKSYMDKALLVGKVANEVIAFTKSDAGKKLASAIKK